MIHRRKRTNEGNKEEKREYPSEILGEGVLARLGDGVGEGVQGEEAGEGCRRGEAGSYAASGHTFFHFSI